ncbi:MAG: spermidine synthase [Acidobacteria bacterium]|nr:MAG: spermidine synthase [Acidobacteriota bacterium]
MDQQPAADAEGSDRDRRRARRHDAGARVHAVMTQRFRVAALLFCSGFCALIYQTVWLRQFRLIFGASTYATGAVLAIFMAGLGIGSALLGKRADMKERPLAFYANLELLIAGAAALSPLLLFVAAKIYFASGGSPQLGTAVATLLRLVLSIIVLGPATVLMGGTLPAAARAVETNDDEGRRAVALLYGVNTLGAVAGTLLSTFFLLETFGNRETLFIAVLVNVLVGIVAREMARSGAAGSQPAEENERRAESSPLHIYAASAVTGFAFLLMELVWYRMLSPILGGTTYMFGLILAVALAGIGSGGVAYAFFRRRAATARAFAITSALEALAIAVPFALGDRIAILANVLRNLGVTGFGGYVFAWTIITMIVVFPAAFIAGVQFPLLIALLGRGREHVGRQIGATYAWNTAGAIAGSLAGGFGLIPLLSAPGVWRLVIVLLAALAMAFAWRVAIVAVAAVACVFATGPTAVWRHSGIGVGRSVQPRVRNQLYSWMTRSRRPIVFDRDGRESSVALIADTDLAFIVNGKADGSAVGDAGNQVMLGLAAAALHPNPKSALVIGLGTGSTAGWLAAIPSIERVDVAEIEPVILDVARACEAVNAGAMHNPKLHIAIADGREMLMASSRRYDVIASEPSNPYRAGIASLFTQDFYEAARNRLNRGGYFVQWVQMYGIDSGTMQTIYATITSVFPHVQTWRTSGNDLMLLASAEPVVIDAASLRARLASEPYRTAYQKAWEVDSPEGFLSRLVANETFARAAAAETNAVNTDDRTVIEFGFARNVNDLSLANYLATVSRQLNVNRPLAMRGEIGPAPPPLDVRIREALQLAERGDEEAVARAEAIRPYFPAHADAIIGELRFFEGRADEAASYIARAFDTWHHQPWGQPEVLGTTIERAIEIARTNPDRAHLFYQALSTPFSAKLYEDLRRAALIQLATVFDGCGSTTIAALRAVEPHPYWTRDHLRIRATCYERAGLTALAERAWDDLERYRASELQPLITPRSPPAQRGSFSGH